MMPDISNPLVMSIIVEKIVDDAKQHFNKQVIKNNPEEVTTLLDAINNDINNTLIAFSVGKNNVIVPNAFKELQPIRSEIQKTYTGSTDISKYLDEYISSILNLRNDAHKFKSTLLFGLRIQFDQIGNTSKKSIVYIFIAIPDNLSENPAIGIIDDKGIPHPIQQNADILDYIKSSLSSFLENPVKFNATFNIIRSDIVDNSKMRIFYNLLRILNKKFNNKYTDLETKVNNISNKNTTLYVNNTSIHDIIISKNKERLSEINVILGKIEKYIAEQLRTYLNEAQRDYNPNPMIKQLYNRFIEVATNINEKIKTLTNTNPVNVDMTLPIIDKLTSIKDYINTYNDNSNIRLQLSYIHEIFTNIVSHIEKVINNLTSSNYIFYAESLIISSYALEQFKALDTSLQNLNSVTYADKIDLKTFFSNYKNTISPQQQPVITPPSNTPINPLSGGTNKSEKILYKGHWYVIRQQGRKKYIKTKDTLIPLVDVKKWQKASKKIKK